MSDFYVFRIEIALYPPRIRSLFNFSLSLSLSLSIHNRALKTTSPLKTRLSLTRFNGEVCLVLSIEESRVGERGGL